MQQTKIQLAAPGPEKWACGPWVSCPEGFAAPLQRFELEGFSTETGQVT